MGRQPVMLSIAQVAERIGAARRSVSLWAKQGKFTGAELVTPTVGSPYWMIPERALAGFEKRGRGRPWKPIEELKGPVRRKAATPDLESPLKSSVAILMQDMTGSQIVPLDWSDIELVDGATECSESEIEVQIAFGPVNGKEFEAVQKSLRALAVEMKSAGVRVIYRNPTYTGWLGLILLLAPLAVKPLSKIIETWLKQRGGRTISITVGKNTLKTKGFSANQFNKLCKGEFSSLMKESRSAQARFLGKSTSAGSEVLQRGKRGRPPKPASEMKPRTPARTRKTTASKK